MKPTALAILVSDLHMRVTTPSARTEKDWYEVMTPAMAALVGLQERHDLAPIICAGDVFDRWNPPSELVTWAMDNVPEMFTIPGQHDLNGHDYDQRLRGAYGAMCMHGTFQDLKSEEWAEWVPFGSRGRGLNIYTMPWGRYSPPNHFPEAGLNLLVIHKYVHVGGSSCYVGAPEVAELTTHRNLFEQFDAVLIGDNHIPWQSAVGKTQVYNHGGFLPQNRDQKNLVPSAGVLYTDGTIEVVQLAGIPEPQWAAESLSREVLSSGVTDELNRLAGTTANFEERLRVAAETAVRRGVRAVLETVIQELKE